MEIVLILGQGDEIKIINCLFIHVETKCIASGRVNFMPSPGLNMEMFLFRFVQINRENTQVPVLTFKTPQISQFSAKRKSNSARRSYDLIETPSSSSLSIAPPKFYGFVILQSS